MAKTGSVDDMDRSLGGDNAIKHRREAQDAAREGDIVGVVQAALKFDADIGKKLGESVCDVANHFISPLAGKAKTENQRTK